MRSIRLLSGSMAIIASIMAAPALAAPGGQGNGNGNAFGVGFGGGQAAGGPAPVIGITIAGQAISAGGVYLAWRRRRKKQRKQ